MALTPLPVPLLPTFATEPVEALALLKFASTDTSSALIAACLMYAKSCAVTFALARLTPILTPLMEIEVPLICASARAVPSILTVSVPVVLTFPLSMYALAVVPAVAVAVLPLMVMPVISIDPPLGWEAFAVASEVWVTCTITFPPASTSESLMNAPKLPFADALITVTPRPANPTLAPLATVAFA